MAFFDYGFRPFFLGGALWTAAAMPLWAALVLGRVEFAAQYGAVAWHAHELLFGYGAAIVAGFVLTAVPSWTGRPPLRGAALLALFALWAAGRAALACTDFIGFAAVAAVDSLFLPALALVVARDIAAARNRRNFKVAAILLVFAAVNVCFHAELFYGGYPFYSTRAAVSVLIALIMLIGGRIVSSFTRNWLVPRGSARLPKPAGAFDRAALGIAVIGLALWTAFPDEPATGLALLAAGVAQAGRLARWAGLQTFGEPLVLILHAGYAFVPAGFLAVGSSVLWPQAVPPWIAIHAWTAGAVGVMTLAMMTRVSRGHSGRPLTAPPATRLLYLLAILAALVRLATIALPDLALTLLVLASIAWAGAFAGFAALYGPMLLRPRQAPSEPG